MRWLGKAPLREVSLNINVQWSPRRLTTTGATSEYGLSNTPRGEAMPSRLLGA